MIGELIGLAREIRATVSRGEASGLNEDELAFYDALADNESAREVIRDDTLLPTIGPHSLYDGCSHPRILSR